LILNTPNCSSVWLEVINSAIKGFDSDLKNPWYGFAGSVIGTGGLACVNAGTSKRSNKSSIVFVVKFLLPG
jgi:hypothetical protein